MTIALVRDRRNAPDPALLRRSLFAWAFTPAPATSPRPPGAASALAWIAAASVPVTALEEAATIRQALDACARTIAGKPAAATTQRRKRAVFHNAASYAVELRLLDSNPIERIQWKAPAVAQTVDRRVAAGPAQIRRLLTAVRGLSDRGQHLEAFYACLYYAYLRPSEAVMLKEADCRLPSRGWGRIDLATSAARAGQDWTATTAPPASNAASSTVPSTKPGPSPSRRSWSGCSAPTSSGTAPHPTGGSSSPCAAGSSRTAPTALSGKTPAPSRCPPPSKPPRWPGGPTTCGMRACPWR